MGDGGIGGAGGSGAPAEATCDTFAVLVPGGGWRSFAGRRHASVLSVATTGADGEIIALRRSIMRIDGGSFAG